MKKAIVLGTRPEIIKLFGIINKMESDDILIHTNQHYSANMDKCFFDELNLKQPDYNLNVGSGNHGEQTAKMLSEIEQILLVEKPDVVIVQGDTNSVLAGALAAKKLHIKVAHVEAGLRSYDEKMPEEINRIMTDHISDYLFCPTEKQKRILLNENIDKKRIFVVGNTISDAILGQNKKQTNILNQYKLKPKEFMLLTMHRAENVDDIERLKFLLLQLELLKSKQLIVYPIHPRTKKRLEEFGLNLPDNVLPIDPVGYSDMITLQSEAVLILTDSGGIQEEACILRVPCITLRTSTERPITIEVGGNMLMSDDLLKDYQKMKNIQCCWNNPFGVSVSDTILDVLQNKRGKSK